MDALVSGDLDTIQTAYRTVNQVLALTERLCSYSSTELHDRVEAQVLRCREYFHKTDTLDEKSSSSRRPSTRCAKPGTHPTAP